MEVTKTKESQRREKSHQAEKSGEEIGESDHPVEIDEFQVDLLREELMQRCRFSRETSVDDRG